MLPRRRWRAGDPCQVRRATELVLGDRADDTLPENTSRLSGSHCMNRRRAFCTISTSELLEIDESEDQNARWQGAARVAESAPLAPGRGQGEVVGLYVFHRPDRGDSAWEPDVGKAVNRRSHDSSLGVAYLKAGSSARAELGGGIANGSERAQDQEFALRKSESASGVEAAEAELGQEPRRASLDGSGRAARLCLISFPYRGACSARPFAYRSASETVPCAGSGSSTPLARNTSLIVATALSVPGNREMAPAGTWPHEFRPARRRG